MATIRETFGKAGEELKNQRVPIASYINSGGNTVFIYAGVPQMAPASDFRNGLPTPPGSPVRVETDSVRCLQPKAREEGREAAAQMLGLVPGSRGFELPEDPVFVFFDCESADWLFSEAEKEFKHGQLTEFGLTTLDSRHIRGITPGLQGCDIIAQMRSRHFRVEDRIHLATLDKDKWGHPLSAGDNFLFGRSEFVLSKDVGFVLKNELRIVDSTDSNGQIKYRNIVLVGHAWENESQYIRDEFDLDLAEIATIKMVLDTQILESEGWDKKPGLTTLLHHRFQINSNGRHNGANDTVFTACCFVLGTLWRVRSYDLGIFPPPRDGKDRTAEVCVRGWECIEGLKKQTMARLGWCPMCCEYGHDCYAYGYSCYQYVEAYYAACYGLGNEPKETWFSSSAPTLESVTKGRSCRRGRRGKKGKKGEKKE